MKELKLLLIGLLALFILISTNAQDVKEKKETIKVIGVATESTRGTNPNIKIPKPVNDTVALQKDSKNNKDKTIQCNIPINNTTEYAVDIYVNNAYVGTLAAWAEDKFKVNIGDFFYCISVVGTIEWGPFQTDCTLDYLLILKE